MYESKPLIIGWLDKEKKDANGYFPGHSITTKTAAMGSSSTASSNFLTISSTLVTSNSAHVFPRPSKLSCVTKISRPPKITNTHFPRYHRAKIRAAIDEDNQAATASVSAQEQQLSKVCLCICPFDLLQVSYLASFCFLNHFNWDECFDYSVSCFDEKLRGSKRNSVLISRLFIVWISWGGFRDFCSCHQFCFVIFPGTKQGQLIQLFKLCVFSGLQHPIFWAIWAAHHPCGLWIWGECRNTEFFLSAIKKGLFNWICKTTFCCDGLYYFGCE